MTSDVSPVVLLHGVTLSGDVWRGVESILARYHHVFSPTAPGHCGGPPVHTRPATISDLVDATERYLDDQQLDQPHLVGNSMGGWIAIELARRGRAATVCALSPAGCWSAGRTCQTRSTRKIARLATMTRLTRPMAPIMLKSRAVRRMALRDVTQHGDRLSTAQALAAADDLLGCTVITDLLSTDEQVAPLDPLPCPMMLAWSEHDKVFPVNVHGRTTRERIPRATFEVLPNVGHAPMIDNPELVASTILKSTGVAVTLPLRQARRHPFDLSQRVDGQALE